ncbi:MAG: VWA domain-containing protein [Myxococcales bacterium]
MLLDDLLALRKRLDRLAGATGLKAGLADRLGGTGAPPECQELMELDRGLDRAGVHTLADARLLAHLARTRAKGFAEARGLVRRAGRAMKELEAQLGHEEREARRRGSASATATARLDDLWARLARVVKVADLFSRGEPDRDELCRLLPAPVSPESAPQSARVAAAEYLLDRARANALDEAAKRRALDQAHEILLRVGSEIDKERARRVRTEVAQDRASLSSAHAQDALGQASPDAVGRLTSACRQGDGRGTWTAALGLYRDAVHSKDSALATAARTVLERLESRVVGGVPQAVVNDRAQVFLEAAGEEGAIAVQVSERYREAGEDPLAALALDLEREEWGVFDLALGAGRFLDAEEDSGDGPYEESPYAAPARLVPVPYPGPVQTMDLAQSISELRHFVITDPRSILYDLASNRQLRHAWLAPEGGGNLTRKRGTGAVRVYVCDASGSMRGPRARFRDAVLIAELNNLSVRQARGQPCVPVYFTFFTDHPATLERVDNADAALRVLTDLFRESPAEGRTDITYALESAFAAIRDARGRDADLARATVVLVTDGEDRVDLQRLWAAKAPVGEIEITLNFVSLGIENGDLKQLVLDQRSAGRRAFYYHLSDEEVAGGRALFDCGLRTLLPALPDVEIKPDEPAVKAAIEALAALASERRRAPSPGASPAVRFDAYFTVQPAVPGRAPPPGDVETVCDLLEAVAEALSLAPPEVRSVEGVEPSSTCWNATGWAVRGECWR